ncbi:MAG: hypothetical protein HY331_05485 [Chloroflexi bacterium]|nr:hypothetical protein [Chloroflexota bacterium]
MAGVSQRSVRFIHWIVLVAIVVLPLFPATGGSAGSADLTFSAPAKLTSSGGRWPALAAEGGTSWKVHAAWVDGTADPSPLRYNVWNGSSWEAVQTITTTAASTRPAIAVENTGSGIQATVAWLAGGEIWYARGSGGSWSAPVRVSSGGATSAPALAVDRDGNVHVAWVGSSGGTQNLSYRSVLTGTLQSIETVGTGVATDPPALAADSAGTIHVAWASSSRDIFYRSRTTATVWSTAQNLSNNAGSYSAFPALAAGEKQDGSPVLALVWIDNAPGYWSVFLQTRSAGAWQSAINVSGDTRQLTQPAVSVSRIGERVSVVWSRGSYFDSEVLFKSFLAGVSSLTLNVSNQTGDSSAPAVAVISDQQWLVAWNDNSNTTSYDVWYTSGGQAPLATVTSTPTLAPWITPPPTSTPTPMLVTDIAPALITPTLGFTLAVDANPLFVWTMVTGTVSYKLELDTSSSFSNPGTASYRTLLTRNVNATLPQTLALPIGPTAATWYWRVTPLDGRGRKGTSSTVGSFVVPAASAPAPLFPLGPQDPGTGGLFGVPTDPITMTWTAVAGASRYVVEVTDVLTVPQNFKSDGSFRSTVFTAATTSLMLNALQTESLGQVLAEGRPYYWHVAGLADDGTNLGYSGAAGPFKKRWSPPGLERPNDPKFGDYAQEEKLFDITLNWQGVPGAQAYELGIYHYDEFPVATGAPVYAATVVAGTSHTVKNRFADDEYAWRVRALDKNGAAGPWSEANYFKKAWYDADWISGAGLFGPRDGQMSYPLLSWKSLPFVSRYEVALVNDQPAELDVPYRVDVIKRVQGTQFMPARSDGPSAMLGQWDDASEPQNFSWRVRPVFDNLVGESFFGPPAFQGFQAFTAVTSTLDPCATANRTAPPLSFVNPITGTMPYPLTVPDRGRMGPGPDLTTTVGTRTFVGTPPVLSWYPSSQVGHRSKGDSYYRVWISYDDQMSNLVDPNVAIADATSFDTFYPVMPLVDPPIALRDSNAGTGYWVEVATVCDDLTSVPISTTSSHHFRFNQVTPDKPTLTAPEAYATVSGAPTFVWEPLTKTDTRNDGTYYYPTWYYRVQVSSDYRFQSDVIEEQTNAVTLTLSTFNKPDGVYYWRVCAIAFGTGGKCDDTLTNRRQWSDPRVFFAITGFGGGFETAVPVSPTNASVLPNPLLIWRPPSASPFTYDVQVSRSPNFNATDIVDSIENTDKPAFHTAAFAYPLGTYYWRVRARNARGSAGAWSDLEWGVKTFTVTIPAPQNLAVHTARNGSPLVDTTIITDVAAIAATTGITVNPPADGFFLSWDAVAGAFGYQVEIAETPGFTSTVEVARTRGTALAPTMRDANPPYVEFQRYYWRVKPLDRFGNAGEASATGTFIPDPPIEAPAEETPTATPTPTPTSTATATAAVQQAPTATSTPTPTPTPTPVPPTATGTPTPVPPTATAIPSPTSTPTPVPAQGATLPTPAPTAATVPSTAVPPSTPVPPTATTSPAPVSATPTSVPSAPAPGAVPPTQTATPSPAAPAQATATPTPGSASVPTTATRTPTAAPSGGETALVEGIIQPGHQVQLPSSDNRLLLDVPASAVDRPVRVRVVSLNTVGVLERTAARSMAGFHASVEVVDLATGQSMGRLAQPLRLTVRYDTQDVGNVLERSLTFVRWDGTAWVADVPTRLDAASHRAEAEIAQPGRYALLGRTAYRQYLASIVRTLNAGGW